MRSLSPADTAVLAAIALFTALRLALAAMLGLGVDEAYTLSVAHDLQLSYYDHPPLQYWIAHLFMPLLGDGRAARLPFIGLFAVSSWLLYRLTQLLFGAEAGVTAVLALNCSAFFTFAGGWVLPDGPLMLALLAAAVVLARHLFKPQTSRAGALGAWSLAGFWLGIAALAKYHALLFAIGLLAFLLSVPSRRRELRHLGPWFATLLALLIATPVIVWNIEHEWISVAYQAGRGRFRGGLHPEYVLANLIGQAIWILPWIFIPLLVAAWRFFRAGRTAERSWYCLCLALPTIAVFTVTPLWGSLGLPHWQMPGWLMLYPVLGEYAVRSLEPARLRRWALACVAVIVLLGTVLSSHAATGFGRVLAPRLFAHGDPTLAAFEWNQLPGELRVAAARSLHHHDELDVCRPGRRGVSPYRAGAGLRRQPQAVRSSLRPCGLSRARCAHTRTGRQHERRGRPSAAVLRLSSRAYAVCPRTIGDAGDPATPHAGTLPPQAPPCTLWATLIPASRGHRAAAMPWP